jgi:hypothetical protein
VAYRTRVTAKGSESGIRELIAQTDKLAEVHNTLRIGTAVTLAGVEVVAH